MAGVTLNTGDTVLLDDGKEYVIGFIETNESAPDVSTIRFDRKFEPSVHLVVKKRFPNRAEDTRKDNK